MNENFHLRIRFMPRVHRPSLNEPFPPAIINTARGFLHRIAVGLNFSMENNTNKKNMNFSKLCP